jgi:hypothetical protein
MLTTYETPGFVAEATKAWTIRIVSNASPASRRAWMKAPSFPTAAAVERPDGRGLEAASKAA